MTVFPKRITYEVLGVRTSAEEFWWDVTLFLMCPYMAFPWTRALWCLFSHEDANPIG